MSLRNEKVIMLSLSGDNFTEFDSILWFKFNFNFLCTSMYMLIWSNVIPLNVEF